jgi:CheY-like chemotaxis protein
LLNYPIENDLHSGIVCEGNLKIIVNMNFVGKRILHVDDDADDREMLEEAIQNKTPEIELIFAENGLVALDLLKKSIETSTLPCLIILDLNMPFLTGKETFQQIRAIPGLEDIPLVILSSGENPMDKTFFKNEGISYFPKPYEFAALESLGSHLVDLCCA